MRPVNLACTLVSTTLAVVVPACAGGVEKSDPILEIGDVAASRDSAFAGSLVPGYPDVVAEYLHIPGAPTDGTPHGLDTGAFLRVRSALDGEHPRHAQAVVVAMPGFSSVPSHWLWLAAQLVHKANTRQCDVDPDRDRERERQGDNDGDDDDADDRGDGCRVEVWIIDRRGSNLEDTSGLLSARL